MREMMRMDINSQTYLTSENLTLIKDFIKPIINESKKYERFFTEDQHKILNWELSAIDFQKNGEPSLEIFPIEGYKTNFKDFFSGSILIEASNQQSSINGAIINRDIINIKFYYLPILRSTNTKTQHGNNLQEQTFQNYFSKNYSKNLKNQIFSGETIYQELTSLLLNDQKARAQHLNFEKYLSETFFQNRPISLIPKHDNNPKNPNANVLHIKIGDEPEVPIFDVGDGIQSIILLTFLLFFNTDKGEVLFFFEEPDMFLHPGLQRTFIQTLLRKEFKDYQYFFTTHSNHFLDMTLDYDQISIYSFIKVSPKRIEIKNVSSPDHNLLAELGVRNSSVFLTNCTIWVEGITDRIYIRKFLELHQESLPEGTTKFFEDRHYSFVEYSGANITHWDFLESADADHPNMAFEHLCGDIFLIADSDNAREGTEKFSRLSALIQNTKIHGEVLQVKEIENLLKPEIIKEAARETFKLNDAEISEEASQIDYADWNIGFWLGKIWPESSDSIIQPSKKAPKNPKLGTIKMKLEFAKNAVKAMTRYDDLSQEAKDLTQKIYNFIQSKNLE